jgi:hypothetical protein
VYQRIFASECVECLLIQHTHTLNIGIFFKQQAGTRSTRPLALVIGRGAGFSGLDEAVALMKVGDNRTLTP